MIRTAFITLLAATILDAAPADFAKDVFPVLQRACFECHGSEVQKGDLRLDAASAKHLEIGPDLLRRIVLPKEDKEAMQQFGSSDSGASLGDILGAALKRKAEKEQE